MALTHNDSTSFHYLDLCWGASNFTHHCFCIISANVNTVKKAKNVFFMVWKLFWPERVLGMPRILWLTLWVTVPKDELYLWYSSVSKIFLNILSLLFQIIKRIQNLLCSSPGLFGWLWSGTCSWKCWTPLTWVGSWFCLLVLLQGINKLVNIFLFFYSTLTLI